MSTPNRIWTWFEDKWIEGNAKIIGSSDHAAWLGSTVFDGARAIDGCLPDLSAHCTRINESARAMHMKPTMLPETIANLAREGVDKFPKNTPVYIRPMYWSLENGPNFLVPSDKTAFSLVLEEAKLPDPQVNPARISNTQFRRPMPNSAPVNAKAGCLYVNVQNMMREAIARGFTTALALDQLGNVAEAASANLFFARDGEVITPIPNGTFLAGITRSRVINLLRSDGITVTERIVLPSELDTADEIFITANYSKVMPATQLEDVKYQIGPIFQKTRDHYMDWMKSQH